MCGITGFTGENEILIRRMTTRLAHRGPDGQGIYTGQRVSLGHARLAILDPRPEGNQPMWNEEGTIAIVYNGEIFNYRELKEREHFTCKTATDTEVLLKLYERHGLDFLPNLRGMYAFGIYDTRTRSLHIVRDPSGIKPLYYAEQAGNLFFASEMRALLASFITKPKINQISLSHFLRLQYIPGPQTMCEEIMTLPPGAVLSWKEGKGTMRDIKLSMTPPQWKNRQQFMTEFPSLMESVVRDHLISDKPIGIFLSGGMDSSIVLHHMASQSSQPVKTFTVRFEATENEGQKRFNRDADLAEMTAKHYGTDHHEVLLTAAQCRDVYADCARALDQPNADSVAMAQFVLAREAKKSVDVVLSGAGGDELFGGYPRYRIAHILHVMRAIPAPLRAQAGALLGYPPDVLRLSPGPALAERLLTRPTTEIRDIVRGNWFQEDVTTNLLTELFNDEKNVMDPVREFMEFDRKLWLIDESLRLNDAMTMASGVECRVPFLDQLIIDASHTTPSSWHVSMRRTKCLLKDTYRGILPDHLYTLAKASFYPPLAKWFRRECRPVIERMLENEHIQELFDLNHVRTVYEDHLAHRRYGLHTLSSLTQLSHWFETVYDIS